MKYKVGDIVWGLEWNNPFDGPPRAKLVRHRITEIVDDFPSSPYCATYPGSWRGTQFHAKSVSRSKNEIRMRAIKHLEKEIQRLHKEIKNERI